MGGSTRNPRRGRLRAAQAFAGLIAAAAAALTVVAIAPSAAAGEGMDLICSQSGYGCLEGTGYRGQGLWGANWGKTGHNCTSYVSYMLAQAGATQPWHPMGNADRWENNGAGKTVIDDIPAIGAVAQWEGGTRLAPGSSGHVAMVDLVAPDHIELSDDSHSGGTRRFRIYRGSPYWPDRFLHIRDRTAVPQLAAVVWESATATIDPAGPILQLPSWFATGRDGDDEPWAWLLAAKASRGRVRALG